MRVALSFLSLLVTLSASACGASAPPAAAANAAPAAPEPAKVAEEQTKPRATEDDTWVGEKATDTDSATKGAPVAQAAEPGPVDEKAPETRTMDVIRKLVVDNRKAARKCYDDARKELKDLKGDVVIHFVLAPSGKVKLAELNQERSTLKAPAVVDCVIGVIKAIPFPQSSRAMETSTNYPFNFTP